MDMAFSSVSELKELINSKKVSIVEVVEFFLDRIERFNPYLNAFLETCGEEALLTAKNQQIAMDKGQLNGLLAGIPISIKDLEMTQGIPTTLGSLVYKDRVPTYDSVVVERVRNAGAIILGLSLIHI